MIPSGPDGLFWADAKPEEKDGIYTSTDRIRTILREMISYKANPSSAGRRKRALVSTEGRQECGAICHHTRCRRIVQTGYRPGMRKAIC